MDARGVNRSPNASDTKSGAVTRGRCVDGGSRERLEYDHIIPVAKGGSNTARNIELRCEACNRRKAATIERCATLTTETSAGRTYAPRTSSAPSREPHDIGLRHVNRLGGLARLHEALEARVERSD